MAELVPCVIPKDAPNSEKIIFNLIKDDERTRDWVVFHSLRIEKHITQFKGGEADFVIISPSLGCFVIEVKGGENIYAENGEWYSKNRLGIINKIHDPFDQVSKNRYSILHYLEEKSVSCPFFVTGVAFPETVFNGYSIENTKEQVFDAKNKNDFFTYIKKLSDYYAEKDKAVKRCGIFRKPSATEVVCIRKALRPNFECIAPLSVKIDNDERETIELTKQQLDVLDDLQYSDSAIIHGPAGTGKTLLAVEMAKRKASRTGTKVALITYTLYLTEFLKQQVVGFDNITVFSISDFFEKKCKEYNLVTDDDINADKSYADKSYFYNEYLPKQALKYLTIAPIQFDTIIIDEAQDFSALYLLVISYMLKGHLSKGNYYCFGDFLYQGIYNHSVFQQEFRCYIEAMDSFPTDKEVTVNCRNSLNIQKELDRITGTSTFSLFEKDDLNYDMYRLYEDEEDELKQLEKTLNVLIYNDKISPSDITILGRKGLAGSVVNKIVKFPIKEYSDKNKDCITFSSIRKFKGLENKVILVIDNNYYNDNQDLYLLYVAISRAKSQAIVFESLEAQIRREDLLKTGVIAE